MKKIINYIIQKIIFLGIWLISSFSPVFAAESATSEVPYAWYISRISGIVAFILFGIIVSSGIVMTTDLAGSTILKNISKAKIFTIHKFLVLIAVSVMCLHFLVLIFDNYMKPTLLDLLIPFKIQSNTNLIALGIIGFYLILTVTISSYLVDKLPKKLWRALHMLSFISFFLILIHGFFMGSDTHFIAIQIMYYFFGILVSLLTLFRIFKVIS